MRPLQAHCHLALGDVFAQVNDRSKAHSELLAAATLSSNVDAVLAV